MQVQDFVQKAIDGGWSYFEFPSNKNKVRYSEDGKVLHITATIKKVFTAISIPLERFILDPKVWKAVSKSEGWKKRCGVCHRENAPCFSCVDGVWQEKRHQMIDWLDEEKSLTSFIESL